MPTLPTLMAFALLSLGVVVLPGPSTFFILAQGATVGRRRAVAAVAGVEIASALRVLAVAAGLVTLLATCQPAFQAIRWLGVLYLLYLAVKAVRAAKTGHNVPTPARDGRDARALRKGLLVGLGNPKMAMFYLSLFPQFVHSGDGSDLTQILILGAIFWVIGAFWDLWVALASGTVGVWLGNRPQARSVVPKVESAAYLALAGWAAASG